MTIMDKIYVGDTEVKKMYRGENLIFSVPVYVTFEYMPEDAILMVNGEIISTPEENEKEELTVTFEYMPEDAILMVNGEEI